MSAATPTKRRVLGAIDANVSRSPRSPLSAKFPGSCAVAGGSPLKRTASVAGHAKSTPPRMTAGTPAKRRLVGDEDAQPAVKKLCSESPAKASPSKKARAPQPELVKAAIEDADEDESPPASQPTTAQRSISPDASSVFDISATNASQFTTITEPENDAPLTTTASAAPTPVALAHSSVLGAIPSLPPPRPRRMPTREEFRQKAEILKLRLSLATYKVKTNQTDVPLEKLQVRPVPGMSRRRTPLPSMSAHTVERSTPVQHWYRSTSTRLAAPAVDISVSDDEEEEVVVAGESPHDKQVLLPRLKSLQTPSKRREEGEDDVLTSSAVKGGAAKGLLSLLQG